MAKRMRNKERLNVLPSESQKPSQLTLNFRTEDTTRPVISRRPLAEHARHS